MGYFQVRYDSRVVNYERKLFIRLATGHIGVFEVVTRTAQLHTYLATPNKIMLIFGIVLWTSSGSHVTFMV